MLYSIAGIGYYTRSAPPGSSNHQLERKEKMVIDSGKREVKIENAKYEVSYYVWENKVKKELVITEISDHYAPQFDIYNQLMSDLKKEGVM